MSQDLKNVELPRRRTKVSLHERRTFITYGRMRGPWGDGVVDMSHDERFCAAVRIKLRGEHCSIQVHRCVACWDIDVSKFVRGIRRRHEYLRRKCRVAVKMVVGVQPSCVNPYETMHQTISASLATSIFGQQHKLFVNHSHVWRVMLSRYWMNNKES